MTTNSTALTEKPKRFSFRVTPEGWHILVLTPAESKRVAKCLILDPDVRDTDEMLQWAEEVYYAATDIQS